MKGPALALGLAVSAIASAGPGIFGTKVSPPPAMGASDAPIGFLPILQMAGALVIVLAAVKWLLPLAMKKFSPGFTRGGNGGIRVEETVVVGPTSLSVVTVRGRSFLVGSTSNHVSCLAELTEGSAAGESKTFHEMLEGETGISPLAATDADPLRDLSGQLERLRRLGL